MLGVIDCFVCGDGADVTDHLFLTGICFNDRFQRFLAFFGGKKKCFGCAATYIESVDSLRDQVPDKLLQFIIIHSAVLRVRRYQCGIDAMISIIHIEFSSFVFGGLDLHFVYMSNIYLKFAKIFLRDDQLLIAERL